MSTTVLTHKPVVHVRFGVFHDGVCWRGPSWCVLGVNKVRVLWKEWKRRVQDPLRPKLVPRGTMVDK